MPHHTWPLRGIFATLVTGFSLACGDANDVATAVTLTLYSVDGVVIPAPMASAAGKPATIGRGFLQGNNWGHACGFSVGLAEGPLTFAEIPACRLHPGQERTFKVTFLDSRFPPGEHTYRFIPE
jgi:hypothetical protein